MNMNYSEEDIQKAFEKSLPEVDYALIDAQILMYRFLGEVEKITDLKKISRRQLAKMVGTSPSYITQLFQGNKIINLEMLGKMQKALGIKFEINAVPGDNQTCEKKIHAFYFERVHTINVNKVRYASIKHINDLPSFDKYKMPMEDTIQKEINTAC